MNISDNKLLTSVEAFRIKDPNLKEILNQLKRLKNYHLPLYIHQKYDLLPEKPLSSQLQSHQGANCIFQLKINNRIKISTAFLKK